MKRKIELIGKGDNKPCMTCFYGTKVNGKGFFHYYFPPIKIEFLETEKLINQEVIQTVEVKGTVIDDFTFCLKIDIRGNYEAKAFGFVSKYIAENWYNVYKKSWWSRKWKKDEETNVKVKLLTITGNEAIVSFGI